VITKENSGTITAQEAAGQRGIESRIQLIGVIRILKKIIDTQLVRLLLSTVPCNQSSDGQEAGPQSPGQSPQSFRSGTQKP
jgi:hypothetical protein